MGVRCNRDGCENNVLYENAFQLIEGVVDLEHVGKILDYNEYHGLFCSKKCLREYLKDRGENQ